MTADRVEWLSWRRGGLGASDVAGVLGISPWASPYSVWCDKTDPNTPVDDEAMGEDIESGRMLEDAVIEWFVTRSGLEIAAKQYRATHPTVPWARATLDGLLADSNEPVAVLEVKVSADRARDWADDGIPAYYQAQAQWQMWVTGIDVAVFAVLHADRGARLRRYDLVADPTDQAFIVERCTRFWDDHVLGATPPPVDAHRATTYALGRRRAGELPPVDLDADPATEQAVIDIADLDVHLARLTEARTLAENTIKAALDEATEGTSMHARSITWRPHERHGLDTKAIRANHPRISKRYATTTTVRPFKFRPNPKPKETTDG